MTAPRTSTAQRVGFTVVTAVLGLFLCAASAPSPLYGLYAASWRFSATSLTAVFAVYALALLVTLLTTASLSDEVGRRPVIAAALTLQALSMILFLRADSLGWLYAARVGQGAATGLVTAAVAASLIDLQPGIGTGALVNAVTPTFGLAAGALGAGALVQYAPHPTRLVYALLLVCFLAVAAALPLVPETVTRRSRPTVSIRLRLGPGVRGPFLATLPCLVAPWALGGLYLSLGPSLALTLSHSHNRLLGGSVVTVLTGVGGLASYTVRAWPGSRAMRVGCAALAGGAVITAAGVGAGSTAVFFAGSALAGAGFGAAFLGAFRTLAALASPERRGELVAAVYVAAYLAFSVPAVAAGVLTRQEGLTRTAVGYALTVALLALAALATTGRLPNTAGGPAVAVRVATPRSPDRRGDHGPGRVPPA